MKLCGSGQHSVFLARKSGHVAGVAAAAAAVSMAAAAVRLATSEMVIAERRCIVGDMLLMLLSMSMSMLWGRISKAREVGFGSHAAVVTEDGEREETWNIILAHYLVTIQRTCVPTSWMLVARNVQDIYLYAHKHLSGQ